MNKDKKNLKNIFIIAGILVIVSVIIVLVIINPFKKNDNNTEDEPTEQTLVIDKIKSKDDLINAVIKAGEYFYKNSYYPALTKDDIKKLGEFGINISLKSMDLAIIFPKELNKGLEDYKCDVDNSKVRIYPESPYGEDNVRVEQNIICNK